MIAVRPLLAEFDLGEYVGVGLNTNQLGYLAGALFLFLFGLSALRRAGRAVGVLPAVWVAVAIGLFAGTVHLAARCFRDDLPEEVRPWTETDRLTRIAAVAILLGCAAILISAHWAKGTMARLAYRLVGVGLAGVAVWLGSGWFADQVPFEVKEWTGQGMIMRGVVVLGLFFLATAFWMSSSFRSQHARWLNRALCSPAIAMVVILGVRWFGMRAWPELPKSQIEFVAVVLSAIGTSTCLLIAGGAYLLRERMPPTARASPRITAVPLAASTAKPALGRALPVAVMLDDLGRPVLPASASGGKNQAGPAGA